MFSEGCEMDAPLLIPIRFAFEVVAKPACSSQTSFPRRRESRFFKDFWTPACAGVTGFEGFATAPFSRENEVV